MDGHSRKDDTSESVREEDVDGESSKAVRDVDNIDRIFRSENVAVGTDERLGESETNGNPSASSSYADTAPPSGVPPPNYNESEQDAEMMIRAEDEDPDVPSADSYTFFRRGPDHVNRSSPDPSLQFPTVKQPGRVRIAPERNDRSRSGVTAIGPPPSYSFVMKQTRRFLKSFQNTSEVETSDRPPPPTYPGIRGLYRPTESGQMERIYNIPSFSDTIWRSRPQPALCRRCGVLVWTTTHSHNSVGTHIVVLALCLFGCWPCCLIPYCMSSCKNIHHHCPICRGYLGTYTPW